MVVLEGSNEPIEDAHRYRTDVVKSRERGTAHVKRAQDSEGHHLGGLAE